MSKILTLANDQLEVSILDPVQDRVRLGSRYCTGGYVYGVTDRRLGVITSGPGHPDEEYPPVFDGQGLPEAFPSPLWPGMDPAALPNTLPPVGTTMLVIGVGLVRATEQSQLRVMPVDEFCHWNITQSSSAVVMNTSQAFANWALELSRQVTLIDRTIISTTKIVNTGQAAFHFRWFPHPFFPLPKGECCKFNLPVAVADNPGYELHGSGFVHTKLDHPWDRRGHFYAVQFTPGDKLVTIQRHPTLRLVTATCSYTPTFLPIWGNCNCFSFEPYLAQTVAPGAEASWSITYDF